MIEIKDIQGNIKLCTSINGNAVHRKKLMSEDYIMLRFNLDTPVTFERGDYVDMPFGRYEVVDKNYPAYNSSTGGYEYEMRLDAYYWKWKNKSLFYDRQATNREAAWSLTRTPDAHLSVVVSNLKALGYMYGNKELTFFIDESVDKSAKLITYNNTNIIAALTQIAEAWDTEWWVEDHIIHLGRCEYNTNISFELGRNVQSMSRSESNDNFATRIYAFGSTRNLPTDYRKNEGMEVEGVVQKRLMLPIGVPYIDAAENMSSDEVVESVVVFDDVYPRRVGTMQNVTAEERITIVEHQDGTKTEEKWNAYRFQDSGLTFSERYVIPGEELRVVFTSGALNGMHFGVIFNPEKKDENTPDAQLWEIVRNEEYGIFLPNEILKPANGDEYVLYGFDTSFVGDAYLPAAEQELKQRAEEYIEKAKEDPSVYECLMNMVELTEKDINLNIGHRVHLVNPAYFEEGRDSRIYGFEKHLDGSQVTYTVGNTAGYSRLAEMEGKIKEITYQGNTYSGAGGSSVYVIGKYDSTHMTDRNVLSSLRVLYEIAHRAISRLGDDATVGHITFNKGLTSHDFTTLFKGVVKEYISSDKFIPGLFGEGFKIYDDNGHWTAEFDNIVVRKAMTVYELIVSKIRSVNGGLVISPANGRIKSVEKTDGLPAFYSLGIEGSMEFLVGDLVRCRVQTPEGSREYWVEVKQVDGDNILCLTAEFKDVIPEVGDELVQMGNTTNVNRQGMLYLTASEDGKPRIQVLDRVDSPHLAGKNKVILGCLDGITDTDFPADLQPSGYGFWAENTWLKGVFVLRSGKTVEQEVKDKVDGVQIGGRNLAIGTSKNEQAQTGGNYFVRFYTLSEQPVNGETYTLSFKGMRLSNNVGYGCNIYLWSGDWNTCVVIKNNFQGGDGEFTFTVNQTLSGTYHLAFYRDNIAGFLIREVKLEKGNKPTDWTLAPEDTDAAIESVRTELTTEITAIPGKIETAVSEIQVGGRNLIKNSNFAFGVNSLENNRVTVRRIEKEYEGKLLYQPYAIMIQAKVGITDAYTGDTFETTLKPNTTYTLSMWTKCAGDIIGSSSCFFLYDSVGNRTINSIGISKPYGGYEKITKVFTTDSIHLIFRMRFGYHHGNNASWMLVNCVKFEEGNKSTDWTPALEDTDAAIFGLDGRIASNTTSITQMSTEISLKASKEELDSLGKTVAKNSSEISLMPDKISLAVDGIQIGAKNIFLTSGQFGNTISNWHNNGGGLTVDSSLKYNEHNTIRTIAGAGIAGNWYKLQNGETYTYSAMIYSSGSASGNGSTPIHYWAGKDNNNQGKINILKYDTNVVAGKWKLCYIIFRLTSDADSFRPFIYFGGTQSLTFNIGYLQLEKGNKPTDWSPAPEDQANKSELLATGIDITNRKIVLTADKTLVQNNSGNQIALFTTKNGKAYLQTELIDANEVVTNQLLASKISATDITTGKLTVTNGAKIGGLKVSGIGLTNEGFNNDAYIIFRHDPLKVFAGIGVNLLPAGSGLSTALGRFENEEVAITKKNIAIVVSAKNGASNSAIQMLGGYIEGFGLRPVVISTSKSLSRYENSVFLNNANEITITLPTLTKNDDGLMLFIKRIGSGYVNIRPSSSQSIHADRGDYYTYSSPYPLKSNGDGTVLQFVWGLKRPGVSSDTGMWVQFKTPRDW